MVYPGEQERNDVCVYRKRGFLVTRLSLIQTSGMLVVAHEKNFIDHPVRILRMEFCHRVVTYELSW